MNAESIIIDLEEQLARSWVRGDREFIENLLDADCTVTDSAGRIWTKDQLVEEAFVLKNRKIDSMSVDDVRVRMIGVVAAVATGRLRAAGTKQGHPVSTVLRFTDVFQFREGRWQMVASHDTRIAPQETPSNSE